MGRHVDLIREQLQPLLDELEGDTPEEIFDEVATVLYALTRSWKGAVLDS